MDTETGRNLPLNAFFLVLYPVLIVRHVKEWWGRESKEEARRGTDKHLISKYEERDENFLKDENVEEKIHLKYRNRFRLLYHFKCHTSQYSHGN